jgi:hypothetical protein
MPRWTSEARARQAAIARERKPWTRSTGPKTVAGKALSRWNAHKHGLHSAPAIKLRRLLRAHNKMLVMMVNIAPISPRHCDPGLEPGEAIQQPSIRFLNHRDTENTESRREIIKNSVPPPFTLPSLRGAAGDAAIQISGNPALSAPKQYGNSCISKRL